MANFSPVYLCLSVVCLVRCFEQGHKRMSLKRKKQKLHVIVKKKKEVQTAKQWATEIVSSQNVRTKLFF